MNKNEQSPRAVENGKEEIKELELFEGIKINVYSDGRIETLKHCSIRKNGRIDNRKGKILKPGIDKYGYLRIIITNKGKRKEYLVHRLVAMAFIPNPDNKPTVNHKDGNKQNNNVENLEWATHKEQKQHAIEHHLCDFNIKGLKKANERRSIKILYDGETYNSIREASRKTGVCQSTIKRYGEKLKK